MRIIRESSLIEYAQAFWEREARKGSDGQRALQKIGTGACPLQLLDRPRAQGGHDYKLPSRECTRIVVAGFEQTEVESFCLREGVAGDRWMESRGWVAKPPVLALDELARLAQERRYFDQALNDTQIKCFKAWSDRGSLEGAITGRDRVLVEATGFGYFEIVDGWGRLLPFLALVRQGFSFFPVEAFAALRN